MLPDIGATELMVIALVALVFVGPKDLPLMLRKLGEFTSKMRRMAADFRTSFDDMARQSELEDLRREVEQMRAKATDAISDPIGVETALRDTMQEVDAAMIGDEAMDYDHYDYDPGVPVEEPAPAPAPKKASAPRKPAARKASTAKAEAGPKPAKSSRAAKAKPAPIASDAAAKPRRRATKIVS